LIGYCEKILFKKVTKPTKAWTAWSNTNPSGLTVVGGAFVVKPVGMV